MLKTTRDIRPETTLALRGLLSNLLEFFFQRVFLSRLCSGFVSLRRACYGLVWPFSIRVFSPVVKRGKSCSGNRGLGIGIRADYGRYYSPRVSAKTGYARRD